MRRPVYFDAGDLAAMTWVSRNTPPRAVVQAYPDTEPQIVWMPQFRYWARPCYPEFTGRCAVIGDRTHTPLFAPAADLQRDQRALAAAFLAPSPEESRARFRAEGVDYVLWTAQDGTSEHRGAAGLLGDARCFERVWAAGQSAVYRVR